MENVVKVVNEIINWLWNRENITLLIAIAGFGMSLYNFFRALWDKRCSFRVDYVSHYCCLSKSGKYAEPMFATVYKGNIIKNLIMDCQSYTKYRPNETTGGIFVSWRRKEELPTGV